MFFLWRIMHVRMIQFNEEADHSRTRPISNWVWWNWWAILSGSESSLISYLSNRLNSFNVSLTLAWNVGKHSSFKSLKSQQTSAKNIHLYKFSHSLTARVRRVFHEQHKRRRRVYVALRLVNSIVKSKQTRKCVMLATAQINVFLVCFCASFRAPPMEKIFFYYKALIFLKLFFIRVFVFVRKTHEIFVSYRTVLLDTEAWTNIIAQIFPSVFRFSKTAFLSECFVKSFLLRSDCWSRRIHKILFLVGYASLLTIKNHLNFFRTVFGGRSFSWRLSDNFTDSGKVFDKLLEKIN